jgi:hypothetical protein
MSGKPSNLHKTWPADDYFVEVISQDFNRTTFLKNHSSSVIAFMNFMKDTMDYNIYILHIIIPVYNYIITCYTIYVRNNLEKLKKIMQKIKQTHDASIPGTLPVWFACMFCQHEYLGIHKC